MFATAFVLLYVAHLLADYVLQTDHQADHKADRTPAGWYANITHAATHVAACAATLTAGWAATDSNAFYTKGGAAYVDQTAHILALFAAALILA